MKKVLVFCLLSLLSSYYLSCQAETWTSGNTTITTSGSTITVSPKAGTNGAMADYTYSFNPSWVTISMTRITIEEGVTHIGAYAFIKAQDVTRVDIPTSVTTIGEGAFASCTKMADVYYAGSPNQWASITFGNDASNPFGDISASDGKMHFYGCTNTSTTLTLEPGLTQVNDYAFYHVKIVNLNIPGSVGNIGQWAFKCAISGQVCVNRTTPPTTGYEAFSYATSATLYVPSGSQSTYQTKGKPWYRSSYGATDGASSVNNQAVSGTLSATYGSGVTWSLGQDGILTFDASASGASKSITLAAGNNYPWGSFRRLVHKVRLRGEIEALGDALAYHWFLSGIILEQNTIPTCSNNIASSSLSGNTSYNSLYNSCNPLTMEIKLSSLMDETERAKLGQDPWVDGNWQKIISDKVIVNENGTNNKELLEAVSFYIEEPFTMQFTRSLTNASYNSFCSPIPMSAAQVESTFGTGTKIHKLASTSYDEEENQLTLNFSDSESSIEAGVPYIIQPANNVSNPTFTNVDPSTVVATGSSTDATHVVFHGALSPVEVSQAQIDAKNFIFLGASNTLTWANGGTLKGLRSYFTLKAGVPAHALAKRPILHIGNDNTPTAIENVQRDDVQCTKVLRDGQLYLMYKGTMYNVQGQRIQ